jgi:PilZ domain-containing protein
VEDPPIEKRRVPRIVPKTPTEVRISGRKGNVVGFLIDISEDGLGVATTGADLEEGETVSLEVPSAGDEEPVRMKAVVQYSRGVRYGLKFIKEPEV